MIESFICFVLFKGQPMFLSRILFIQYLLFQIVFMDISKLKICIHRKLIISSNHTMLCHNNAFHNRCAISTWSLHSYMYISVERQMQTQRLLTVVVNIRTSRMICVCILYLLLVKSILCKYYVILIFHFIC